MGGIGNAIKKITADLSPPGVRNAVNNPDSIFPKSPTVVSTAQAKKTAAQGAAEGNILLKNFQQGKLSPGEQGVISSYKKSANASLQQEMGQAGLSKSSAAALGKGAIDAQGAQMAEQFLQGDLQSSMDFMGMTMNSYYQTQALDMQQNEGVMGALGGIGTAIGSII